jgi:hypothetical protein
VFEIPQFYGMVLKPSEWAVMEQIAQVLEVWRTWFATFSILIVLSIAIHEGHLTDVSVKAANYTLCLTILSTT